MPWVVRKMYRTASNHVLLCATPILQIQLEDALNDGDGRKSKAKLTQPAQQRWVSLAKTLKTFLSKWDTIEEHFIKHRKKMFPLVDRKPEVRVGIVNGVGSLKSIIVIPAIPATIA